VEARTAPRRRPVPYAGLVKACSLQAFNPGFIKMLFDPASQSFDRGPYPRRRNRPSSFIISWWPCGTESRPRISFIRFITIRACRKVFGKRPATRFQNWYRGGS
jgi:hypothetical protein